MNVWSNWTCDGQTGQFKNEWRLPDQVDMEYRRGFPMIGLNGGSLRSMLGLRAKTSHLLKQCAKIARCLSG